LEHTYSAGMREKTVRTREKFPGPNKLPSLARLSCRIFLTRGFHTRENAEAQKDNSTHDDPVRGQMHEIRGINQAANYDRESTRVKSEGHGNSEIQTTARGERLVVQKETPCEI
jgi:hypothetical protein